MFLVVRTPRKTVGPFSKTIEGHIVGSGCTAEVGIYNYSRAGF